ncbi:hypothetical protein B7O87_15450 [Cylindrospermopsis raciborskii CENA303]|uniref:Uncharacterized protein n=1 Tax=Cylindrospermopsis raciborskii CENA303 TaxID=1170769 RepID=A0A1X4G2W8_9CYAN|nr:hypothetical protein [Cylindrospermopsis raciborskii]OSO87072.1 hypothetical protein B7O87_15450 [Cylindrospermopsis raciborskii CENA303]
MIKSKLAAKVTLCQVLSVGVDLGAALATSMGHTKSGRADKTLCDRSLREWIKKKVINPLFSRVLYISLILSLML